MCRFQPGQWLNENIGAELERPTLRGGARLLLPLSLRRRGAFVMKGARERRLLWLPRSSGSYIVRRERESSTLLGSLLKKHNAELLHRINAIIQEEGNKSRKPPRFIILSLRHLNKLNPPALRKTCRPRRQKWVKRSSTRTMTERTKPPVRRGNGGPRCSVSPPFFPLSSF